MSDKSARLQALLIDPFGGCTAYLRSSRAFREPRPTRFGAIRQNPPKDGLASEAALHKGRFAPI
jgi:hypothetical protein